MACSGDATGLGKLELCNPLTPFTVRKQLLEKRRRIWENRATELTMHFYCAFKDNTADSGLMHMITNYKPLLFWGTRPQKIKDIHKNKIKMLFIYSPRSILDLDYFSSIQH